MCPQIDVDRDEPAHVTDVDSTHDPSQNCLLVDRVDDIAPRAGPHGRNGDDLHRITNFLVVLKIEDLLDSPASANSVNLADPTGSRGNV